jgi:hypothetical protein
MIRFPDYKQRVYIHIKERPKRGRKQPRDNCERFRKKERRVNLKSIIHQYWMYDYYSTRGAEPV